MQRWLLIWLLAAGTVYAAVSDRMIAHMFVLGFYGTSAPKGSTIRRDICEKELGGVLLFDRHPTRHGQAKNIASAGQLRRLTAQLSACRHQPLIAVDQEGGLVQRIRFAGRYPKASVLARRGAQAARKVFARMAGELHRLGINYDLAPVADLALNPHNKVIVKYGRSFGEDPERVAAFDGAFIHAMHQEGVLTALKHFPGHGSSRGDTHKGFVDVTRLWNPVELEPYRLLIDARRVDSIMVAHIFNRRYDPRYPASLSYKVVTQLLRKQLGYRGVVITDDLQMGAISHNFKLKTVVQQAINAGNDLLLFGNQLAPGHEVSVDQLIRIVRTLIREKKIDPARIVSANRRITAMKRSIGLRP